MLRYLTRDVGIWRWGTAEGQTLSPVSSPCHCQPFCQNSWLVRVHVAIAAVASGHWSTPCRSCHCLLVDCWICPCRGCEPPMPMCASQSGSRHIFGVLSFRRAFLRLVVVLVGRHMSSSFLVFLLGPHMYLSSPSSCCLFSWRILSLGCSHCFIILMGVHCPSWSSSRCDAAQRGGSQGGVVRPPHHHPAQDR